MDLYIFRKIYKATWRPWRKTVSIALVLSFLFPYLTWAFEPARISAHPKDLIFKNELVKVPAELGTISEAWQGDQHLVIYLQDLHCNYEVQMNIAKMIEFFQRRHGLNLIAVEGASKPINVTQLSRFQDEWVKHETGSYLVKQGKISGAEYFSAMSKEAVRLEGIENADLYGQDRSLVEAFLNSESQGCLLDIRENLNDLKASIYHPALQELDARKMALAENRVPLVKYAADLANAGRRLGVRLNDYPGFQAYVTAHSQAFPSGVDPEQLFQELDRFDQAVRTRMYRTAEERLLDQMLHRLDVLEKLLNISANREELAEFRKAPQEFQSQAFIGFVRQHSGEEELTWQEDAAQLDPYLRQVENFYRVADQRSQAFVNNLLDKMQVQSQGVALLITGGYHTEEVLAALKAKGVSYLCVKPSITRPDVLNPYFSLLKDERTPLEKLLDQNQNILALPTAFTEMDDPLAEIRVAERPRAEQLFYQAIETLKLIGQMIRAELTGQADPETRALLSAGLVNPRTKSRVLELPTGILAAIHGSNLRRTSMEQDDPKFQALELGGREITLCTPKADRQNQLASAIQNETSSWQAPTLPLAVIRTVFTFMSPLLAGQAILSTPTRNPGAWQWLTSWVFRSGQQMVGWMQAMRGRVTTGVIAGYKPSSVIDEKLREAQFDQEHPWTYLTYTLIGAPLIELAYSVPGLNSWVHGQLVARGLAQPVATLSAINAWEGWPRTVLQIFASTFFTGILVWSLSLPAFLFLIPVGLPLLILWLSRTSLFFAQAHAGRDRQEQAVLRAIGVILSISLITPLLLFVFGVPVPLVHNAWQAALAGIGLNLILHSFNNTLAVATRSAWAQGHWPRVARWMRIIFQIAATAMAQTRSRARGYVRNEVLRQALMSQAGKRYGELPAGEFPQLQTEINQIFSQVITATQKVLTDQGKPELAEGLEEAQLLINDHRQANASALIYYNFVSLNLGVLRDLQEDGRLSKDIIAFILAHEVTHLVQLREEVLANRVGLMRQAGQAESLGEYMKLKFAAKQESYGRENDADVRALAVVSAAGFNVSATPEFFRMVAKAGPGSQWARMWDEHPPADERIHILEQLILSSNWPQVRVNQPFSAEALQELMGPRGIARQIQAELAQHELNTLVEVETQVAQARNPDALALLWYWGTGHALRQEISKLISDPKAPFPGADLFPKLKEMVHDTYFDDEMLIEMLLDAMVIDDTQYRVTSFAQRNPGRDSMLQAIRSEPRFQRIVQHHRQVVRAVHRRSEQLAMPKTLSLKQHIDDTHAFYELGGTAFNQDNAQWGLAEATNWLEAFQPYFGWGVDLKDPPKWIGRHGQGIEPALSLDERELMGQVVSRVIARGEQYGLDQLLEFHRLVLRKQDETLAPFVTFPLGTYIAGRLQSGPATAAQRAAFLDLILQDPNLAFTSGIDEFLYAELLADPNNPKVHQALHENPYLIENNRFNGIRVVFLKRLEDYPQQRDQIFGIDDLERGNWERTAQVFRLGTDTILDIQQRIERSRSRLAQLQQLETHVSQDTTRLAQHYRHAPFFSDTYSKTLWNTLRNPAPFEQLRVQAEVRAILQRAGIRVTQPIEAMDWQVVRLIYFFDHGGLIDLGDFRDLAASMIRDFEDLEELQTLGAYLTSEDLRKRQIARGMEPFYQPKENPLDFGWMGIGETLVHEDFYTLEGWSEYILYFNTLVYLRKNGQAENVQRLLNADQDPGGFQAFRGELYGGQYGYSDETKVEVRQAERRRVDNTAHLQRWIERMYRRFLIQGRKYLDRTDWADQPEALRSIFQFLWSSPRTWTDLVEEMVRMLPASVFRNYLLLQVLAREVSRLEPRARLNRIDPLAEIQRIIQKRERQGRDNQAIYDVVDRISPLLYPDERLRSMNLILLRFWTLKQAGKNEVGFGGRKTKKAEAVGKTPTWWGSVVFKLRTHPLYIRVAQELRFLHLVNIFVHYFWYRFRYQWVHHRILAFFSRTLYLIGNDLRDFWMAHRKDEPKDQLFKAITTWLGERYVKGDGSIEEVLAQLRNHVNEQVLETLKKPGQMNRVIRWIIVWVQDRFVIKGRVDFLHFDFQQRQSHLDSSIPALADERLRSTIAATDLSFADKRAYLLSLFQQPSPIRDLYLELLAQHENQETRDIRERQAHLAELVGDFKSPEIKDKFALLAMQYERQLDPAKYLWDRQAWADKTWDDAYRTAHHQFVADNVALAKKYFEPGYTRDDVLLAILQADRTDAEYELVRKELYQYRGNVITDEEATKRVFWEDRLKMLFEDAGPADKKEVLLWILKVKPKPLFLREYENYLGISFDRLQEMFGARPAIMPQAVVGDVIDLTRVGMSARREFIRQMFKGEAGLMQDEALFLAFMDDIFEHVVPRGKLPRAKLKQILHIVLKHADPNRRLQIVQAMSINMASAFEGEKQKESEAIGKFFESMGLVGVKMAQTLAHSYDIDLPEDLRETLANLSNRADPLSKMIVFETIRKNYADRGGFEANFDYIGDEIGSASVKVVYICKRKGVPEERVFKVKRPAVDQQMEADLIFLKKVLKDLTDKGFAIPKGLSDRISGAIAEDTDFHHEERNTQAFERQVAEINPPEGFALASGARVFFEVAHIFENTIVNNVTMETKLVRNGHDLKDEKQLIASQTLSPQELAEIKPLVFDFLMTQTFKYGFFLADPHGGNFFLVREGNKIRIILIDSGSAEVLEKKAVIIKGQDDQPDRIIEPAVPLTQLSPAEQENESRALLEAMIWLHINPRGQIPEDYLPTSIFFTKTGYLRQQMGDQKMLQSVGNHFRGDLKKVMPEIYTSLWKQMNLGQRIRFGIHNPGLIVQRVFKSSTPTRGDPTSVGGIAPVVRELAIRLGIPAQTYDRSVAWFAENGLALLAGSVVAILVAAYMTGQPTFDPKAGYILAWPIFFFTHFFKDSTGRRASTANLFFAGSITAINLGLILLPIAFPWVLLGSYASHFLINLYAPKLMTAFYRVAAWTIRTFAPVTHLVPPQALVLNKVRPEEGPQPVSDIIFMRPAWLGPLYHWIVNKKNQGKTLAVVNISWEDTWFNRKGRPGPAFPVGQAWVDQQLPGVGPDDYVYAVITTTHWNQREQLRNYKESVEYTLAVVQKKALLGLLQDPPDAREVNRGDGSVLFIDRFRDAFDPSSYRPTREIKFDQLGIHRSLQGNGLIWGLFPRFVEFLSRHFGGIGISSALAHERALRFFRDSFTEGSQEWIGFPDWRDPIPLSGTIPRNYMDPFQPAVGLPDLAEVPVPAQAGKGGIAPVIKQVFLALGVPSQTYDVWIAWFAENSTALLAGAGLTLGLTLVVTGQAARFDPYTAYRMAWPILWGIHFLRDRSGAQATPENTAIAGLIALINLSLGSTPLPLPWLIAGSFGVHFGVNWILALAGQKWELAPIMVAHSRGGRETPGVLPARRKEPIRTLALPQAWVGNKADEPQRPDFIQDPIFDSAGWLGTLGQRISKEFNRNRPLPVVHLFDETDFSNAVRPERARAFRQLLARELADIPDDQMVYAVVHQRIYGLGESGQNQQQYLRYTLLVSTKAGLLRHMDTPYTATSVNQAKGGVLFIREFEVDPTGAKPTIRLNEIGINTQLQDQGLVSPVYARVVECLSRHFANWRVTASITHPRALDWFEYYFAPDRGQNPGLPSENNVVSVGGTIPKGFIAPIPVDAQDLDRKGPQRPIRQPQLPLNEPLLQPVNPVFRVFPALRALGIVVLATGLWLFDLGAVRGSAAGLPIPAEFEALLYRTFPTIGAEIFRNGGLALEPLARGESSGFLGLGGKLFGQLDDRRNGLTLRLPEFLWNALQPARWESSTGRARQRLALALAQQMTAYQAQRYYQDTLSRSFSDLSSMSEVAAEPIAAQVRTWADAVRPVQYFALPRPEVVITQSQLLNVYQSLMRQAGVSSSGQLETALRARLAQGEEPSIDALLLSLEGASDQDPAIACWQEQLRKARGSSLAVQRLIVSGVIHNLITALGTSVTLPSAVAGPSGQRVRVLGLPGPQAEAMAQRLVLVRQGLKGRQPVLARQLLALERAILSARGGGLDRATDLTSEPTAEGLDQLMAAMVQSLESRNDRPVLRLGESFGQNTFAATQGFAEVRLPSGAIVAQPRVVQIGALIADTAQIRGQLEQDRWLPQSSVEPYQDQRAVPNLLKDQGIGLSRAIRWVAKLPNLILGWNTASQWMERMAMQLAPQTYYQSTLAQVARQFPALANAQLFGRLKQTDLNSQAPLSLAYRRVVYEQTPAARAELAKVMLRLIPVGATQETRLFDWLAFSQFFARCGAIPSVAIARPDPTVKAWKSLPVDLNQLAQVPFTLPIAIFEAKRSRGALGFATGQLEKFFELDDRIIRLFLRRGLRSFAGSA